MVVLCVLLIETLLLSYLSSGVSLSVGWWAGRLYGLFSASIVLVVLLSETMTLYNQLARSISSERRARESRLTAMEALSASIAHEVNQPLASMITNADAGLRWLGNENPDLEETRAALKRIVSDGHRADKVIKGIRTMFRKGAQERVPLDMNQIIEEVLNCNQRDALLGHVSVGAEVDKRLPLVIGNPIQIQEVVANLVANAFDAMISITDRARVLRVTCKRREPGGILVTVEDSGSGLEPKSKDRIFEPFFSTKSDGMGMGLMFCQAVVEAHSGRIWATDNVPQGAIFQFILPADDESVLPNAGSLR
jgi:signal transduction histidine kinase